MSSICAKYDTEKYETKINMILEKYDNESRGEAAS